MSCFRVRLGLLISRLCTLALTLPRARPETARRYKRIMAGHAAGAAAAAAGSLRLEAVASSSSHNQPDSEFIAFKASMRLPIAPVFASKGDNLFPGHDGGMDGVREVLAGWVMRQVLVSLEIVAQTRQTNTRRHDSSQVFAATPSRVALLLADSALPAPRTALPVQSSPVRLDVRIRRRVGRRAGGGGCR